MQFQRVTGVLAIVELDETSGNYRLLEDVSTKGSPDFAKQVGMLPSDSTTEANGASWPQSANRFHVRLDFGLCSPAAEAMSKWKGKPLIPARIIEQVKWALGCYTGAQLESFTLADLPGDRRAALDALRILWKAGVIGTAKK